MGRGALLIMKKFGVLFLGLALAAAFATSLSAQRKSEIIQKIIVKVNGEIFTQTDLVMRQIQALRDQNQQVQTAQQLQTDAGLQKALTEVTPAILEEAIDELLLVQRGREMGVRFGDEQFKQALDNVKKQNKLDDAGLKAAMAQEGITMEELRTNFERSYFVTVVQQQEIMRNMTLTEQEARQHYNANLQAFMKPATITLREISVLVPTTTVGGQATVNVAADEAAKEKIEATRARALKGEDFAKLVAEVSESGTKANGGQIGPVVISELRADLAELFGKMQPGDVSEPIRTQQGYQIFKLETRSAAEPEPFDKVRDQIARRIYDERLDGETAKYLAKLRVQALIEWKDDTYKALYEKAQAAKAKSGH